MRIDADLLLALNLDDTGIVDDDFHRAIVDFLNGKKDLLRQVAVCLVYQPVGVWHGGVHYLFDCFLERRHTNYYCSDRD